MSAENTPGVPVAASGAPSPHADVPAVVDAADAKPGGKPTHYKVLCISMYTRDVELADALVREMKARGYTRANRSQVLRLALAHLDLNAALAKEGPQR